MNRRNFRICWNFVFKNRNNFIIFLGSEPRKFQNLLQFFKLNYHLGNKNKMPIFGVIFYLFLLYLLYKIFTISWILSIVLLVLFIVFLARMYFMNPQVEFIIKIIDFRFRIDNFFMGVYENKGFCPLRFKLVQKFNQLISGGMPVPPDPVNTHIESLKVKSLIDDHQVPMKIYIKEDILSTERKIPIVYYLYPGGFSVELPMPNKDEVLDLGVMLVTISYRLAPENKFPKALEDSYSCLSYITAKSNKILEKHWDGRLVVYGASAGGNIATCSTLLVRDRGLGLDIICQLLACPALFYTDKGLKSQILYKDWYFHGESSIKYINDLLMRDQNDYENPYLCPLKAKSLKGLPDAYFLLGERDYFCSEGELYYEKLKESGNKAICRIYPGEHGFDISPNEVGKKAKREMFEYLKKKIEGKDK